MNPAVRATDPETSVAAATVNRFGRVTDRARALHLLTTRGPLTDFELADLMGRQQTSAGKRRGELVAAGLVRWTGHTRPAPSGCQARVWEAVPPQDVPAGRATTVEPTCTPPLAGGVSTPRPGEGGTPGFSWMTLAACRGQERRMRCGKYEDVTVARARAICAECPVRRECRQWACQIPDPVPYHIAGGLTPRERPGHDQRYTFPELDMRRNDL